MPHGMNAPWDQCPIKSMTLGMNSPGINAPGTNHPQMKPLEGKLLWDEGPLGILHGMNVPWDEAP